jgi:RNA polymerase sigma-70 factor (ECF subfamily)
MQVRARRYEEFSDEELVRGLLETADQDCFAELFRRHQRRIYLDCFSFFNEKARAEDATQETFLRAYQSRTQFREGDYLAWLRRIARHVCIDQWRKKHPAVAIEDADEEAAVSLISPLPDAERQCMFEQLHDEMAKLPEEQRRCLELKIEGHSYEEIAMKTGLPVDAVRSHLQNGRRTLRSRLEGIV